MSEKQVAAWVFFYLLEEMRRTEVPKVFSDVIWGMHDISCNWYELGKKKSNEAQCPFLLLKKVKYRLKIAVAIITFSYTLCPGENPLLHLASAAHTPASLTGW